VKAHLSEIAEDVERTPDRVHITKNGREYAVLLAAQDLESIEATLELLADPEAQERIRRSRADIDEHQVRSMLSERRADDQ
jgi:antitoxin YefM